MRKRFSKSAYPIIIFILLTACSAGSNRNVDNDIVVTTSAEGTPKENVIAKTAEPLETGESESQDNLELDPITIHHIGDLTSRFAPYNAPAIRGLEDWAEDINDNNGLMGRELILNYSENGGMVEETVLAFEEILKNDDNPLVIIVYQSEHAEALIPIAKQNKIPVINLGIQPVQSEFQNEEILFNFYVPYEQQLSFFLEFLVDNWAEINPVTLDTGIRLAFFAWDNHFGHSALTDVNRKLMASLGIELVAEEYHLPSSVEDLSNTVVSAWYAGANVIYTNTYRHGPALILNNLNRLVLRDFFVVGGPSPTLDITSYSYLEYNSYLDGLYAPSPFSWYTDENNNAVLILRENMENSDRTIADNSQRRLLAQGVLETLLYAIEQAILEVGNEELNGNSIYEVLDNISNYQVMESLFEVDFSNGKRTLSTLNMRQVKDFLKFDLLD